MKYVYYLSQHQENAVLKDELEIFGIYDSFEAAWKDFNKPGDILCRVTLNKRYGADENLDSPCYGRTTEDNVVVKYNYKSDEWENI